LDIDRSIPAFSMIRFTARLPIIPFGMDSDLITEAAGTTTVIMVTAMGAPVNPIGDMDYVQETEAAEWVPSGREHAEELLA
jgi:hypothetical protein